MADTIQQFNTPSIAELLFVLFESTKVVSYTQADWFPQSRNNLSDSVIRILGIHTKGVSGAVRLDHAGRVPLLLVACDDPAYLNYVKTTITLLRTLARADKSDSLAIRSARSELITSVLRHSLGPHTSEYDQLCKRLQADLESGIKERFIKDQEDPEDQDSDQEDLEYLGTKCSQGDVEKWNDALTHALGVIDTARDIDNNDVVEKFWEWAQQRYFTINQRDGKRVYAHVGEYSEPPSAPDLLRHVDHIVQAIVFPIRAFTDSEEPSPAWLDNLTIRRVESSPPSSFTFESTSITSPERLKKWLSDLVYDPLDNACTSAEVLERIISTGETGAVQAKWASYAADASVHPEMMHLIEVVNTRLAVPTPETGPDSEKKDDRQRTCPSLVACTGTSCPACVLCYRATKAAYGLPSSVLNLFPTEGEIRFSFSSSPPCCVPVLPPVVKERLKIMLVEEIRSVVEHAIVRLSPKPEFRPRPVDKATARPFGRPGPV